MGRNHHVSQEIREYLGERAGRVYDRVYSVLTWNESVSHTSVILKLRQNGGQSLWEEGDDVQ